MERIIPLTVTIRWQHGEGDAREKELLEEIGVIRWDFIMLGETWRMKQREVWRASESNFFWEQGVRMVGEAFLFWCKETTRKAPKHSML